MNRIKGLFFRPSYEALTMGPKTRSAPSFDAEEERSQDLSQKPRPQALFCGIPASIVVAFLAISNVTMVLMATLDNKGAIHGYHNRHLNSDIKRASAYCWYTYSLFRRRLMKLTLDLLPAPILDQFDMSTRMVTFNGALRDNSSIWRQPPSPEVDAAWDRISTEGYEIITVAASDVLKSGKSLDVSLKAPTSWRAADSGAYIVQVEVFHQIHCLNELRKEMNYDYYYKSPPDELHRSHKAHCLHMLLQSLMCTADVGIITHNWVHNNKIPEPKIRPMPDFNVVKKCADFDGLLNWTRETAVRDLERKFAELQYMQGEKVVPGDGYA
ncbi:hypothetical protein QQS21_000874 [Conoideocrella luteorostrata]|uniref:Tat pathway signal sequence n=1 Tax=Conoideocrella luteorostrata TaxID=1105319 RepID=A0AAJ0CY64_9HYPO|nr:hypothetical protein QQS21_000874 [Conoideocrella luteorostrata]